MIRILPMSGQPKGFRGLSIEQVQTQFFLRRLPAKKGQFHYPSSGLNAPSGTLVLFQFQARIIASALFRRDEKFEHPLAGYAGILHFDPASIRTFDPLDIAAMRKVWPAFRAFGHVKQRLNPTLFPKFKRQLKHVMSPSL
jgi:hypothetical protein